MSKKTFTTALEESEAPAVNFITSAQKPKETAPQNQQIQTKAPEPKKSADAPVEKERLPFDLPEVERPEIKNRKFMLLLKPSTFKALKAKATQRGESVNSLINRLVEAYLHG